MIRDGRQDGHEPTVWDPSWVSAHELHRRDAAHLFAELAQSGLDSVLTALDASGRYRPPARLRDALGASGEQYSAVVTDEEDAG
jgi:hypothetical protein